MVKAFWAFKDLANKKAIPVTKAFVIDQEVCHQKVANCISKLDLSFLDEDDADLAEDQPKGEPESIVADAIPTLAFENVPSWAKEAPAPKAWECLVFLLIIVKIELVFYRFKFCNRLDQPLSNEMFLFFKPFCIINRLTNFK